MLRTRTAAERYGTEIHKPNGSRNHVADLMMLIPGNANDESPKSHQLLSFLTIKFILWQGNFAQQHKEKCENFPKDIRVTKASEDAGS